MINRGQCIVLADDFTGAAEISGIANRFGLVTELRTDADSGSDADVFVVDGNTRSCSKMESAIKTDCVLSKLKMMASAWIYKKTDSVLRGHVLDEIAAMLKILDRKLCLLLPENPAMNRTISNGRYFINGKLLHYTAFSRDPEYPVKTADVLKLMGTSKEISMFVQKADKHLPDKGIVLGEAENSSDMKKWAVKWQENMIAAGGAEFFENLLSRQGYKPVIQTHSAIIPKDVSVLCIWGSSIKKDNHIYDQFKSAGFQILEIPVPDKPSTNDLLIKEYTQLGSQWLSKTGRIVLTFISVNQRLEFLTDVTAQIVKNLLKKHKIGQLLIEGGSTASAIARNMNWDQFVPADELMPGVVRLKVVNQPGLYLTVKPGSYRWPVKIL